MHTTKLHLQGPGHCIEPLTLEETSEQEFITPKRKALKKLPGIELAFVFGSVTAVEVNDGCLHESRLEQAESFG